MDLTSIEDSMSVRIAAGVAVTAICLAIGFRSALSLSLGKIVISLTRGVTVVEKVDDIVDDLDRLRVSQRAFLYTGEDRFAQGVIESATGLIENVSALKQLTAPSSALARQIARVSHSVDWALDLVGESNDLQHYFGTAAAVTLLDDDGDHSIGSAETAAMQLKKLATKSRSGTGSHRRQAAIGPRAWCSDPEPPNGANRPSRRFWPGAARAVACNGAAGSRYSRGFTKTAAATTVVHSPSRSPIADWVTLRVLTILSDILQMSLRSS